MAQFPPISTFEDIRSRDDYVLREHFDNTMLHNPIHAITVFNLCVDPKLPKRGLWGKTLGLVIRSREELELPAFRDLYPEWPTNFRGAYLAEFAIEAGSLVDALPKLESRIGSSRQINFLHGFAGRLAAQIESQT